MSPPQPREKRDAPTDGKPPFSDLFYSLAAVKDEVLHPTTETEALKLVKKSRCERVSEYLKTAQAQNAAGPQGPGQEQELGQGGKRVKRSASDQFNLAEATTQTPVTTLAVDVDPEPTGQTPVTTTVAPVDPATSEKAAFATAGAYLAAHGYAPIPDQLPGDETNPSVIAARTDAEIGYCRARGYVARRNQTGTPVGGTRIDVLHPDQVGFVVDATNAFWRLTLGHQSKPYKRPPTAALGSDEASLKKVAYHVMDTKDPARVAIEATRNEWRRLGYPSIPFPQLRKQQQSPDDGGKNGTIFELLYII